MIGNRNNVNRNSIVECYENVKLKLYRVNDVINENLNSYERVIVDVYRTMKYKKVDEKLATIPIDEINKDKLGFRISALKDHGIYTIKDLLNRSVSSIESIYGISSSTASWMMDIAREIRKRELENVVIPLNPNNLDANGKKIYTNLYLLFKKERIKDEIRPYRSELNYLKSKNNSILEKSKSMLNWMFSGSSFKDAANEVKKEYDAYTSQESYRRLNELIDEFKNDSVEYSVVYEDLTKNLANYIARLESIVGKLTRETGRKNYIRNELVEEINKVELDLRYLKNVHLRNYQEFGVKYIIHQEKTLLGDEMGLGKTIQAIGAIAHLKAKGGKRFIIICPLGVLVNWKREVEKFSTFRPYVLYGATLFSNFHEWKDRGGVAVTTFESVNKLVDEFDFSIDITVVDEAHYIKNPNAMRTNNALKVVSLSKNALFMTGTPIENKVEEMIFLIDCLNHDLARKVRMESYLTSDDFRRLVAPVYLRRLREDVLTELPEKIEMDDWVSINDYERDIYNDYVLRKQIMDMRQVSWNIADTRKSSKLEYLKYIVSQAKEEGEKLLIFSFFKNTIAVIAREFGDDCIGVITGGVSSIERQKLIDKLGNAKPGQMLVCQINAAGVGLNIQAASYVVICEPQYKPSTETQAISRSYRMGQAKTVMVHHLLAEETCDESITNILIQKQAIFDQYANDSYAGDLSNKLYNNINEEVLKAELERLKVSAGLNAKLEEEKENQILNDEVEESSKPEIVYNVNKSETSNEFKKETDPTVMATVHLVSKEKLEKEKEEKLNNSANFVNGITDKSYLELTSKYKLEHNQPLSEGAKFNKSKNNNLAKANTKNNGIMEKAIDYGYDINRQKGTVTEIVNRIKQPYGGYIPYKDMYAKNEGETRILDFHLENIRPSYMGTLVDNLTRIELGESPEVVFKNALGVADVVNSLDRAKMCLSSVKKGLDIDSVRNAYYLSCLDHLYKGGMVYVEGFYENCEINIDEITYGHVKIMVERSVHFFNNVGPVIARGLEFKGDGKSLVLKGEMDYVTNDTIWDMKVLSGAITSKNTLQIAMYYILGKKLELKQVENVKRIGIYNPRLNVSYTREIKFIPENRLKQIKEYVIGYHEF